MAKGLIRIEETSLGTAVERFSSAVQKRLRYEKADKETIKGFIDAIGQAANLCEKHFSGEFGRFGGQFTSHGTDHAARVLSVAEQLATRIGGKRLKAKELFFLGIAAILHDIGMTAPLPQRVLQKCQNENERWTERRKRHGEATAKILQSCRGAELKVIAKASEDDYHTFLPHICAAHCTSGFQNHVAEIRKLIRQHSTDARYATLAGILLLADELDITCVRARPDRERYHEFRSNLTKAHWWKHWLVSDAEIDGGILRVTCVDETAVSHAGEFSQWTKAKLEQQLDMLQRAFDHEGNHPLWRLEVSIINITNIWWQEKLPELTTEVLESAQSSRLAIPGQRIRRIIDPERLRGRIRNRDAIKDPSVFFRAAIASHISHFRGQGQHVSLEQARKLYVEDRRNMDLITHATAEWLRYVRGDSSGVNLKIFVGEIGVGKTHFLGVFLHDLRKNYAELCQKTILVRAELTERQRGSLIDLQRAVADALYEDLDQRLGIAEEIRSIMLDFYTPGVHPPVPACREEIINWDLEKIVQFIEAIGKICKAESRIAAKLGPRGPSRLCFFLDNSDQLIRTIVGDLYNWCNNMSGIAEALLWVFLRPETFKLLQIEHQRAPIGLRSPEPIYAPTLSAVVEKRINTFPMQFKRNEEIRVPFGPGVLTPEDIQKAVRYVAGQALDTTDHMLVCLTDRIDTDSQPDIRAGLQGLLGILGSHIMTDNEYGKAVLGMATTDRSGTMGNWPRLLEALILGRRIWFSSACGAVENLLYPPNVETYGDYFLLIHILQCLRHQQDEITFLDLCVNLQKLGYTAGRVQVGSRYLSQRQVIREEGNPEDDPFVRRTFPLLIVDTLTERSPYRDQTLMRITPWGDYHISTMLKQARYWKHIFYDLVLPASFTGQLDAKVIHKSATELSGQLRKVFEYLSRVENSWLYGHTSAELRYLGIEAVISKIQRRVLDQLR